MALLVLTDFMDAVAKRAREDPEDVVPAGAEPAVEQKPLEPVASEPGTADAGAAATAQEDDDHVVEAGGVCARLPLLFCCSSLFVFFILFFLTRSAWLYSEHAPEIGQLVEPRFKQKKAILLMGYNGTGYQGMQRNPGARSIEDELFSALFRANLVREEAVAAPHKVDFQRTARTDKGVHACCQVHQPSVCGSEKTHRAADACGASTSQLGLERALWPWSCACLFGDLISCPLWIRHHPLTSSPGRVAEDGNEPGRRRTP